LSRGRLDDVAFLRSNYPMRAIAGAPPFPAGALDQLIFFSWTSGSLFFEHGVFLRWFFGPGSSRGNFAPLGWHLPRAGAQNAPPCRYEPLGPFLFFPPIRGTPCFQGLSLAKSGQGAAAFFSQHVSTARVFSGPERICGFFSGGGTRPRTAFVVMATSDSRRPFFLVAAARGQRPFLQQDDVERCRSRTRIPISRLRYPVTIVPTTCGLLVSGRRRGWLFPRGRRCFPSGAGRYGDLFPAEFSL